MYEVLVPSGTLSRGESEDSRRWQDKEELDRYQQETTRMVLLDTFEDFYEKAVKLFRSDPSRVSLVFSLLVNIIHSRATGQ